MSESVANTICVRCGATMSCGMIAGAAHCWCHELPHVMPVTETATGCLCRNCLQAEIDARRRPVDVSPPSAHNME